jgi:hypothetical protein
MADLLTLRDIESGETHHLDQATGIVYSDPEGLHELRRMEPTEYVLGEKGVPLRDEVTGRMIHVADLRIEAAQHYYRQMADQYGCPVDFKVWDQQNGATKFTAQPGHGSRSRYLFDRGGRLVSMDLGIADVHTNATLPNYAAGYKIAEGVADIVSPPILVPKASDVYATWNKETDFQRKLGVVSVAGGSVAEVNPGLAFSTYTTVDYALGGFLPTEIQTNADTPIRVFPKLTQMIVDGLRLEREIRVATQQQTSGNWGSNLVTTIAAGAQWDGGGASDPIAVLHHSIEQSFLPVTGIVWSELVEHDFLRNPAVQKYFTFKDMIDGLPDPQKLSSTLRLPPIYTATMKYLTGGNLTYVWGNHVVLLHQPREQPPTSQIDVATAYTMRWIGGEAPDGSLTAGFLVRTYFDPKRGPRGGTMVVAVHNDSEQQTSGFVGGLILNAHQ